MPLIGGKSKSKSSKKDSSSRGSRTPAHHGDLQDLISLKDPVQWSVEECCAWLESIDLGELRESFNENSIFGSVLLELSEEDMKSMGILKLGHRKKLLKKIAALRADTGINIAGSSSLTGPNPMSGTTASTLATSSSSNMDDSNRDERLHVKCCFKEDWYAIKLSKSSTTFKSLRRQLEDQFQCRLRIKYLDHDGDQVTIKREADWQECLTETQERGSRRIRLFLYERSSSSAAAEDSSAVEKPMTAQQRSEMFSMFEYILDPAIIISETGIVQYVNKKVEPVLGYSQSELIGRTVNVLMTEDVRPYHDNFLRNYLQTGVSRIIGIGRDVIAVKKDGTIMPVHLEVSEKSMGSGKLYFIGILKEAKQKNQEKSMIQQEREVLDTIIVPAVIIDAHGLMNGFNKAAQEFLGYTLVEVIGKNVSMLMPSPHREAHDGYIQKYIETGKGSIIGIGRRVVAQHKDGTLIPAFLTVTEKRDKDKRFFTGILQEVQKIVASAPSKTGQAAVAQAASGQSSPKAAHAASSSQAEKKA